MRGSKADVPVALEVPEGTLHVVECGGMAIELGSWRSEVDPSPYFKGLPDDRCQCPHWGYVLQGQLRYRFADHEEVYNAGDAYYIAPGHTAALGANTEYVEFSPAEPYHQTAEVIEHNMVAMQEQA